FSSNETGIYNVYTMPVEGGKATQITKSTTDTTFAVSYFPKDDRVLYTRVQAGTGRTHLNVRSPNAKERALPPGDKLKATFAGWKHDGSAFYVLINDRDPRFFDVYRFDATTYERKLVYKNEAGYDLGDISDDGEWIAFGKTAGSADSDIYLLSTG